MKILMGVALLVSALMLSWPVQGQNIPEFVRPEHRLSVAKYLRLHPHYRVATESDCQCAEHLAEIRKGSQYLTKSSPDFQPYYAVGDINGDGRDDFALGLIDTRRLNDARQYVPVVVFHGPFPSGKPKPALLVAPFFSPENKPPFAPEVFSLERASTYAGRRYPPRLILGPAPFGSDDNWALIYDWRKRRYIVQDLRPG